MKQVAAFLKRLNLLERVFSWLGLSKFWDAVSESCNDHTGKKSHTRILSYLVLIPILAQSFMYMALELGNAYVQWQQNKEYTPSGTMTTIFGMILAHHVAIVFNKKGPSVKTLTDGDNKTSSA